jgi:serine/threonine protein kinase
MTSADEDAHAKIADFGFARKLEGLDLAQTVCGSPLYMVNINFYDFNL